MMLFLKAVVAYLQGKMISSSSQFHIRCDSSTSRDGVAVGASPPPPATDFHYLHALHTTRIKCPLIVLVIQEAYMTSKLLVSVLLVVYHSIPYRLELQLG